MGATVVSFAQSLIIPGGGGIALSITCRAFVGSGLLGISIGVITSEWIGGYEDRYRYKVVVAAITSRAWTPETYAETIGINKHPTSPRCCRRIYAGGNSMSYSRRRGGKDGSWNPMRLDLCYLNALQG